MSNNINDKINSLISKKIEERVNEEIENRVNEALSQFFGQSETEPDDNIQEPNVQETPVQEEPIQEENAPAPEKTDHDLYVEEFDLLQSRPGLTRKELREDKRWQEFLAKRPGPKMETVYNDYLCHLERERLAQENADLRKRLAEANAEFVNFKLELDRQLPNASGEIDGELERKKVKTSISEPFEFTPNPKFMDQKPKSAKRKSGKPKAKKRYENLKKFIIDQKLTQPEFADLIGMKQGCTKIAKQVWISEIIGGRHKNLRKFWNAVKKTFGLTPEQMEDLKKLEEPKKAEEPAEPANIATDADNHLNSLLFAM